MEGIEPSPVALRKRRTTCCASPADNSIPARNRTWCLQLRKLTCKPAHSGDVTVAREGLAPSRRGGHGSLRPACLLFHHPAIAREPPLSLSGGSLSCVPVALTYGTAGGL